MLYPVNRRFCVAVLLQRLKRRDLSTRSMEKTLWYYIRASTGHCFVKRTSKASVAPPFRDLDDRNNIEKVRFPEGESRLTVNSRSSLSQDLTHKIIAQNRSI